jgi:hypothetical protein
MVTPFLFELGPAFHPPFKSADTAFTVTDLGRGNYLNRNLLNEALKATRFTVLPGCPLLFMVVPEQDGEA